MAHASVAENIAYPLRLRGMGRAGRVSRVGELLELVGLPRYADRRPATLSGGEQQRVAIARALVRGPRLILADEPTGALDIETCGRIMSLLDEVADDVGAALVTITHDLAVAARAGRILQLEDGRLRPHAPASVAVSA